MDAGRELDTAVVTRIMGWHTVEVTNEEGEDQQGGEVTALFTRDHDLVASKYGVWDLADFDELPHYSTDIAAAFEMEAEIERRGLYRAYVDALIVEVGGPAGTHMLVRHEMRGLDNEDLWLLIHATPEQRCRAALAAVDAQAAT